MLIKEIKSKLSQISLMSSRIQATSKEQILSKFQKINKLAKLLLICFLRNKCLDKIEKSPTTQKHQCKEDSIPSSLEHVGLQSFVKPKFAKPSISNQVSKRKRTLGPSLLSKQRILLLISQAHGN